MSNDPATRAEIKDTRARAALLEAQMRLRVLEAANRQQQRVLESQEAWEWIDGYGDLVDRMRGPDRELILPISTANDRRYGANWPFWRTWVEHARLRASARLLHGLSNLAQGALNGLTSYTIGKGFVTSISSKEGRPPNKPLQSAVKGVLDEWSKHNAWPQLQQEAFLRSRRDGEYLVREFTDEDDGMTTLRLVGAEFLGEPPGEDPAVWSYGVHNDREDNQKILGYWISYDGNWGAGEEVGADEMIHVKVNVDGDVKRGLTDLSFDAYDTLKSAQRLVESLAEGSAIQASIALMRQHEQSSSTQVSEFVAGIADYVEPNTQSLNGSRSVQRFTPGTIVDAPKGWNFVVPPFASNAQGFVAVVQAVLRSVAVKWNAPEWIISSDASNNNYSSSLTAESPFVRTCQRWQAFYQVGLERLLLRALRAACGAGRVKVQGREWSYKEIRAELNIGLEPPTLETRNRQEEASVNTTYLQAGIKSPQTICAELGLDYEEQVNGIEEHEQRVGGQAGGMGDMFGGGSGGGGGLDDLLGGGGGSEPQGLQEAMIRKKDKLGRNICYDDGKRVSCGPSRAEAGKGKAGDTVQGAISRWRDIYRSGNVTPQHVDQFAAALGELSLKELGDLKKRMEVRAGGRKAEMARKIAERLLAGAPQAKEEEPAPTEEKPAAKEEPTPQPGPQGPAEEPRAKEKGPTPAKKTTASVDEYADLLIDAINGGDRGYKAKLWSKGGRTRVYIRDSKGRDVGHIEVAPGGAEVLVNRAKGYFSDLLPEADIVADEDIEPEVPQKRPTPQPAPQSPSVASQPAATSGWSAESPMSPESKKAHRDALHLAGKVEDTIKNWMAMGTPWHPVVTDNKRDSRHVVISIQGKNGGLYGTVSIDKVTGRVSVDDKLRDFSEMVGKSKVGQMADMASSLVGMTPGDPTPTSSGPQAKQPEPAAPRRLDDAGLLGRIEQHRAEKHANRDHIPIHELRDIVRRESGTDEGLNDALRRLEREGKVRLIAIGDRGRMTSAQLADSIQGANETFAYVEPLAAPSVPLQPAETAKASSGQQETAVPAGPTHTHDSVADAALAAGAPRSDVADVKKATTPGDKLKALARLDSHFLDRLTDEGVVTHNEVLRTATRAYDAGDAQRMTMAANRGAQYATEARRAGYVKAADFYQKHAVPFLRQLASQMTSERPPQPAQQPTQQSQEPQTYIEPTPDHISQAESLMREAQELRDDAGRTSGKAAQDRLDSAQMAEMRADWLTGKISNERWRAFVLASDEERRRM